MNSIQYLELVENLSFLLAELLFVAVPIVLVSLVVKFREYLETKDYCSHVGAKQRRIQDLRGQARQVLEEVREQVGRYRADIDFNVESPSFFDIRFPPAGKFWAAMTQWEDRDGDGSVPGDKLLEEAEELQQLLDEAVAAARMAGPDYLPPVKLGWRRIKESIGSYATAPLRVLASVVSRCRWRR